MLFSKLAEYLEKLERTTSRNEMTNFLSEVLSKAGAGEADKVCYLLLGELLPSYRGVEFNIAEKMMIQVLARAYGQAASQVERHYKSQGDLGDVAGTLVARHRPAASRIDVSTVYRLLFEAAGQSGEGSQERRVHGLAELLGRLDKRSVKFVTRIPLGKLRLGFSEATLLDALSVMVRGDKSARAEIERAYNVTADIGAIARQLKTGGLRALARLEPKPGIPIRPSLAERLSTPEEAVKKAGPRLGVEAKLDGFRTQIHVWSAGGRKQVATYSRNLENTTAMFPEIVAAAGKLGIKSTILDGEAIGYDPPSGKFALFQETAQRKRKYDIEAFAKKIPLFVFAFDILYLNGRSLLGLPFRERRIILTKTLSGARGAILLAGHEETDDPEVIRRALKKSIAAGLEGLVLKNLDTPYEAGKRGFHWVKLKASTAALEKLRAGVMRTGSQVLDTVDCIVMGAYQGRGKRAAFGVGGFLLGVRGPDDRYYSISRLGTGLSDDQFREARRRLAALKVGEMPKNYVVGKEIAPDFWVRPALVLEILADEITLSSRHAAGRGASGRGYSLRFPRLVRFRDDKNPQDATTVDEIVKFYQRQKASQ